ncbi:hypothetical protein RhiirA1_48540 [Rhizophagus irregularis]|uniref:Uncharacterized protein n=1 Tax=Rhizophagus irregularis TaxID=588596 RepID=A0A2N0R6T2_9GLOM|nr:hypothetical protein RhiirA1_48540 [Rhizophagus irregularis]
MPISMIIICLMSVFVKSTIKTLILRKILCKIYDLDRQQSMDCERHHIFYVC